jgi:LysR family transcriptional regulator, salicylic acid-responsive activator of bsdBCD
VDVKQLRYFSAIAEEGQITRAAKKLHMAQPPLSQQLKLLEDELGVVLINRNGKNFELTVAGQVLYQRAEKLLLQLDETVTEVKEVGEGLKGELKIGSVKTCFSYIPERLRYFRKNYPLVTFRIHEGDSFRLAQSIRNRDIELAIVRLPLDLSDFTSYPLPKDRFVAVMPKDWGGSATITMKELVEMPIMLLHRISGVGLYELVMEQFRKHGIEPNVVCKCADAAMILSLVRAEVGATLLPKSTLFTFNSEGINVVDIEDGLIESDSSIIWMKDHYLSKSATRFIETFDHLSETMDY